MWEIKRIIHGYGLRYHKEKAYFDAPAEITGVILRNGRVALPNRQHLKLRKAQQSLSISPHDAEIHARIAGLHAQASQIRKAEAAHEDG